jgi:hypothetical protein
MVGVLLLPATDAWSSSSRRMQWIVSEGEDVFAVLAGSVNHYDASTDQWSALARGVGRGPAREVWLDGDFVWVAFDSSLCFAPRGSEQWVCFGNDDGLPVPAGPLAFDQDFVWAATRGGVARFDRYLEEWVVFDRASYGLPSDTITAVVLEGEYLWVATPRGVGRLDTGLERWEGFPEVGREAYFDALGVAGSIWFMWPGGATVYRTQVGAFEEVGPAEGLDGVISDHEQVGGELWLVTQRGLLVCDPEAGVCTSFAEQGYLRGATVRDVSAGGDVVWLATDNGVFRYWPAADPSRGEERWQHYTQSQGLSSLRYVRIHAGAGGVFAVTEQGDADHFVEDRWRTREAGVAGGGGVGWIRLDEEGLRVVGPGSAQASLTGTATRLEHLTWEDGERWRDGRGRAQLTLVERVGVNRSASCYYDNTDLAHERYGLLWRADDDVLREAGFGWIQPGGPPHAVAEPPETRAGYARLELGPRTERLGRSLLSVNGWRGRLTARFGEDVFSGSGSLYRLSHRDLVPGTAEVRMDGVPLAATDYTLDHTTGTLLLTYSGSELVDETTVLAVSYQYRTSEEPDAGGGSMSFGPSDHTVGSVGVTTWWEDGRWQRLGEVGGEFRTSAVVIRPRVGFGTNGMGAGFDGLARWKAFRLEARRDWFEQDLMRLGMRSSLADTVLESSSAALRIDPRWWIPLSVGGRRDRGTDGIVREGWVQAELKRPGIPGIRLKGLSRELAATEGGDVRKVEGFLSWEVPEPVARRLGLRKLGAKARVTRGRVGGWGREDRNLNGDFVHVVASPLRSLFVDGVLRQAVEDSRTDDRTIERSTRVRGSARSSGLVPGVTLQAEATATVVEDSFAVAGDRQAVATALQEFYGRAAPGAWWSAAAFVDADFSFSSTRQDSFRRLPSGTSRWDLVIGRAGDPDVTAKSRLLQGRLYLRPVRVQEIVLSARRSSSTLLRQSTLSVRTVYDPAASFRLTAEASLRLDEECPECRETDRYVSWKLQAEGRRGQRGLARLTLSGEQHRWDGETRTEFRPAAVLELWGDVLEVRGEAGVVCAWGTEAGETEYWQSMRADISLGANLASRISMTVRESGGGAWGGRGEARITLQL